VTGPGPDPVPDPRRPAGWSAHQLRTLAALSRAFAPGFAAADYERWAHEAAGTLNAVADPGDLRQLRLVVSALDSPVLTALSGGGWRRISDVDGETADRLLLRWAASRLGPRRTAFQAFKRLLLFLAWTDPLTDGRPNRAWAEIGYAPPPSGEAATPAVTPLVVDRGATDSLELEADVVIVGSGAGGGVVAARLAEAGRDVLVVEAARHVPEGDLPTLEREAFRRLYLDQGTTATADLGITIAAGAALGGGTTVNWTTCLEPPAWLRAEWTAIGLEGFDGSETDADLARLREELDLRPPTAIPPKDQAILDGAAALGWESGPTERNAGPCTACGGCGFGCRAGAKRSGLRAHLVTAQAAGARILDGAVVDLVDREGRPGWATGVRGRLLGPEGTPGRPFRVRAATVVVAAGALRTPLLLTASGVTHPELGENLHLHPAVVVAARMPQRIETWSGPLQAARSLEFVRPGPASSDGIGPAHGGFFIETGPAHPGLASSALPWEGGWAARELMRAFPHIVPLGAALRDTTAGSVGWSRARRPRIHYQLSWADRRTVARAKVELSRLGRAAGAVELLTAGTPPDRIALEGVSDAAWEAWLRRRARADYGPNRVFVFSAHQMGTARAGATARTSVCDPDGRVRSDQSWAPIGGLFVADASLFPTAAGVNPMLTIMALAERTARAVLADAGPVA
jgi:choline dehydrogenase-like flavoprotein